MNKAGNRSESGFSLPEVLVATVIFGFVTLASVTGTVLFAKLYANLASQTDLQRTERWLEENVGMDIRTAETVDYGYDSHDQRDELTIKKRDGTYIYYWQKTESDGTLSLYRETSAQTRRVASSINGWKVDEVSTSGPTSYVLSLFVTEVTSKGKKRNRTITSKFTPRS